MKLWVILIFINVNVFAGHFIPNIRRRQTDRNTSGAAVGWSKRNNINLGYGVDKIESENSSFEITEKSTGIIGFLNQGNFSAELTLQKDVEEMEFNSMRSESDFKIGSSLLGYQISEKLSLGLDLIIADGDFGPDLHSAGFAGSYKVSDDVYLGLGLGRLHVNGTDLNGISGLAGIGILKKNMSFEGVLTYRSDDKNEKRSLTLGRNLSLLGEWIYHPNEQVEVHGVVDYESDKNDFPEFNTNEEEKNYGIGGEVEYLVNKHFAVGGFVQFRKEKMEDKTTSGFEEETNIKLFALTSRLNIKNFQLLGHFGIGSRERELNGLASDSDTSEWSAVLSYMF